MTSGVKSGMGTGPYTVKEAGKRESRPVSAFD